MVFMTRVVYECSLHEVDREHGCPFFLRAKRGNLNVQSSNRRGVLRSGGGGGGGGVTSQ